MATITLPAWDTTIATTTATECQLSNRALSRIGADLIRDDTEDTPSARQCRLVFAATREELLRTGVFQFTKRLVAFIEDEDDSTVENFAYSYKLNIARASNVCTGGISSAVVTLTNLTDLDENEYIGYGVTGTYITTGTYILANTSNTLTLSAAPTNTITSINIIQPTILNYLSIDGAEDKSYEIIGVGDNLRIHTDHMSSEIDGLLVMVSLDMVDPDSWEPLFTDAFVLRLASKIAFPLIKSANLAQLMQQEFAALFEMATIASKKDKGEDYSEPFWTDRRGL
jgi:hypothetical protein